MPTFSSQGRCVHIVCVAQNRAQGRCNRCAVFFLTHCFSKDTQKNTMKRLPIPKLGKTLPRDDAESILDTLEDDDMRQQASWYFGCFRYSRTGNIRNWRPDRHVRHRLSFVPHASNQCVAFPPDNLSRRVRPSPCKTGPMVAPVRRATDRNEPSRDAKTTQRRMCS